MIKTRLIKLLSKSKKYIYLNILVQWLSLMAQIIAIFLITSFIADTFNKNLYLAILFDEATRWINVNLMGIKVNWLILLILLVILLILLVFRVVAAKLLARINYLATTDVKNTLRDSIYDKLLRLGPSYKEKINTAELVQLTTEGVEQLETYFAKYLPQLFYSLLAPISLFICLVHFNLMASLVLLICVPLIPISIVVVQKIAKSLLSKYWDAYAKLGDSFLDNLNALTSLKLYGADIQKSIEMDKEASHFRKITMKVLTMQLNSTSVMDIVAYGGAAVGMIVTIVEYFMGHVSLAGALSIILLSSEFFIPLRLLGSYFHIAMNGMAASDKIFNFLDLEEEKRGDKELAKSDKPSLLYSKNAKADSITVTMENVRFAYEEKRQILDGIDLTLPAASFISLVGESGSGKSTIASLLTGKIKNFKGRIKINGLDILDIKPESLASNICLVRTNSYIFTGTVRENLLMAKADASDEELLKLLDRVNLKDVFMLRDGLDTKINERATNLSGGQAQRLCLARAILYDCPMYIFDEATSNIDAESEEIIMELIHELAKTKTVLLISHRLKNVEKSDCIYMLKDGKIIESGSHEKLIKGQDSNLKTGIGAYAKLYNAQVSLENFRKNKTEETKIIDARAGVCHNDKLKEAGQKRGAVKKEKQEDYKGFKLVAKLTELVKPLRSVMLLAITLGTLGYLCAISLPVIATGMITETWGSAYSANSFNDYLVAGLTSGQRNTLCIFLFVIAVLRGFLHYAEQYCNHFIAFKLLAIIRHKVFENLRRLAPAKLDNKERGNLISLITSDIELLEVFYAHTISPIAIAFLVSLICFIFMAHYSLIIALVAAVAYVLVGIVIPLDNSECSARTGSLYRDTFANLNSQVLDSIRGIDETIQYGDGLNRKRKINKGSQKLLEYQEGLATFQGDSKKYSQLVVLLASYIVFVLSLYLAEKGSINLGQAIVLTVTMMSSFGPVLALSSLSNNLNQTFASARRVISLIEEKPELEDITGASDLETSKDLESGNENNELDILVSQLSFAYNDKEILRDYNAVFEAGKITGIHGESGCGKSTLIKLIMRYYKPLTGEILIANNRLDDINTASLRRNIAFVSQETELINDTIAANIGIGNIYASREDIIEAAKKASIDDFIESLDNSYDTVIGELGDRLSGGEKQRIGLARAFLSKAPIILLDEPTSNLDSLNEGIILESLAKMAEGKTIIIVSHRASTMNAVDVEVLM